MNITGEDYEEIHLYKQHMEIWLDKKNILLFLSVVVNE